eukprot:TRINITY_DN12905_c0_g1_i2.p2 TRINITY_DN12905_c0_g1~~TRINITY_DN12905_c0_g1_i2.p2  ORF type:complete len:166 (-),score=25.07 TRINITY_DN12905_c0_g1_i2:325-822(-)
MTITHLLVAAALLCEVCSWTQSFSIPKENYSSLLKNFDIDEMLDRARFQSLVQDVLVRSADSHDKAMMIEIADSFVSQDATRELFSKEYAKKMVEERALETYVDAWKHQMYLKLIKLYEIEADESFMKEMLNDPVFYGLTYDAYKIMTFQLGSDTSRIHQKEYLQ